MTKQQQHFKDTAEDFKKILHGHCIQELAEENLQLLLDPEHIFEGTAFSLLSTWYKQSIHECVYLTGGLHTHKLI